MPSPDDVLARLAEEAADAGLVMDFDGVLAPITADPAASRLLGGTESLLDALAGHLRVVAVLSGRPVSFLADRVPAGKLTLLGSYGAERLVDGVTEVLPEVRAWLPKVAAAERQLARRLSARAGIHIEGKGSSVAVHWRQAPDREVAQRLVEQAVMSIGRETGLQPEPGKFVLELRPPVSEDKGTALRRLYRSTGCRVIAYAGDDRGDLPAFAAAAEVGGYALVVHGTETAEEVSAIDGAHFAGPEQLADWLRRLLARLEERAQGGATRSAG